MSRPSTAILCIASGEQAFAREWFEYHLGLGFDHIYCRLTDPDMVAAQAFYTNLGLGERVSLHPYDRIVQGWQTSAYNEMASVVKEDWLLVIDLDEFLYLHQWPSIGAYLASMDASVEQVQFPWLNVPGAGYTYSSVLSMAVSSPKFANQHVKSAVRRSKLQSIGIHSHRVANDVTVLSSEKQVKADHFHYDFVRTPSYYSQHPFVIHACSRGYLDTLSKICTQRFFNGANGEHERQYLRRLLTGAPRISITPLRLLLLSVIRWLPSVELELKPPVLNTGTDMVVLRDTFLTAINTTVDFNLSTIDSLEQRFEERYLLDYKLNQLDLSAACDPEAYLYSSNQVGFVNRLRYSMSGKG
ncbi:MAG: glycosyltransferase family 2 protein [Halioglobus sp.]|nr:glycosyltransferase family 2 protein [Halioglobus sp.]